jgi:hypothetical protein
LFIILIPLILPVWTAKTPGAFFKAGPLKSQKPNSAHTSPPAPVRWASGSGDAVYFGKLVGKPTIRATMTALSSRRTICPYEPP